MWKFIWLTILFYFIFSMIRKIFTGGTRRQQDRYSSHRGGNGTSSNAKKSQPKKKIIGKNEGEYVDYTEIK